MILGYLFLAHLLGDFVFQPKKLVVWKTKKNMGIFVHAAIHFIIGAILLGPMILQGNIWVLTVLLGVNFIHFWIDKTKINYDFKHNEKIKSFLVDQLMHVIVISVVYLSVRDIAIELPLTPFYDYYSNPEIIAVLCFAALIRAIYKGYTLKSSREL